MGTIDWVNPTKQYLKMGAPTTGEGSELGKVLAAIAAAVQPAMETYLGRTLTAEEVTEALDGNDRPTLFLSRDPIRSVSSLTINGQSYTVPDPAAPTYPQSPVQVNRFLNGLVFTNGGIFLCGRQNVIVTYTAGLEKDSVVPPSLIQAGVMWICDLFKRRDRIGLTSEQVAGDMQTAFDKNPPAFVQLILDQYKRVALA